MFLGAGKRNEVPERNAQAHVARGFGDAGRVDPDATAARPDTSLARTIPTGPAFGSTNSSRTDTTADSKNEPPTALQALPENSSSTDSGAAAEKDGQASPHTGSDAGARKEPAASAQQPETPYPPGESSGATARSKQPKDLSSPPSGDESHWVRCFNCREIIYRKLFEQSLKICPHCGYHYRLTVEERIAHLFDEGSFHEHDADLSPDDVIGFATGAETYPDVLARNRERSGHAEACVYGTASIRGHEVVAIVFDFAFMGGSMGTVVGEKVCRAFALAQTRELPVVAITASGGARMQEGMFSLFQMARTTLAASRFQRSCPRPFICVMTNPTTGGVLASFASRADVILAEPGALIGFAGPRVVEKTVRTKLPRGFQTAEFLHERGIVDQVVRRDQLPTRLRAILEVFGR
jgi:acetyl-CoA carboxylase carboxyl transferase subunit beta